MTVRSPQYQVYTAQLRWKRMKRPFSVTLSVAPVRWCLRLRSSYGFTFSSR